MRLLAFEKVECNCTSFPNVESVIIPAKFADRDIAEMIADIDIQSNKEDSDGTQEDEQYKLEEDKHNDEQDEDMEKIIEREEYTEVMKMKGRSYHEHFQSYLKVCKEMLVKNEQPEVRFFPEPGNRRDENAIVLQAKVALTQMTKHIGGQLDTFLDLRCPKLLWLCEIMNRKSFL